MEKIKYQVRTDSKNESVARNKEGRKQIKYQIVNIIYERACKPYESLG